MPKKPKITEDDLAAFHQAVAGTKPLIQKKIRLSPHTVEKHKQIAVPNKATLHFNETQDLQNVGSEEFISYKQTGVPDKTLRKLRKGQYNVEAILDLHGMSSEEAKTAINHFFQQCLHKAIRVALIIHGKSQRSGTPILKNKLNHWLRDMDPVLAFCSAAPTQGSRGAIYVLLKHAKEEDFV